MSSPNSVPLYYKRATTNTIVKGGENVSKETHSLMLPYLLLVLRDV